MSQNVGREGYLRILSQTENEFTWVMIDVCVMGARRTACTPSLTSVFTQNQRHCDFDKKSLSLTKAFPLSSGLFVRNCVGHFPIGTFRELRGVNRELGEKRSGFGVRHFRFPLDFLSGIAWVISGSGPFQNCVESIGNWATDWTCPLSRVFSLYREN